MLTLFLVTADIAIEIFTCLLIFKNIFSFGLTYHGYDWLVKSGTHSIFNIVASVQVGVCATTVLMCKLSASKATSGLVRLAQSFADQTQTFLGNGTGASGPDTTYWACFV